MKPILSAIFAFFLASSCWAQLGIVQPRVSPDGQWIAGSYQGAIVKFPAAGGVAKVLTTAEGWDVEPAWSGDGKKIAFLRSPNFGGGRLVVIDAATVAEVALPKPVNGYGKIWWSPDGGRLLGMLSDQGPRRLGWLDLKSGEVTELDLGGEDVRSQRMVWALSPDGARILYALNADEPGQQSGNAGPQTGVWLCQADGSDNRQIVEWPARIYDLSWDADGGAFFATTDRGVAHNDIWRVPLENPLRDALKLTYGQADEERASVPAAGGKIFFTTNRGGSTEVLVRQGEVEFPVSVSEPAYDGRLRIKIADGGTTRVSVKKKGGKHVSPPGSLYRVTGVLGHFYTNGCEFAAPAGDYEVLATRGTEFQPVKLDIAVAPDAEAEIKLERWIDLAERGWFSGENHVHANYGYGEWYNTPETILRQCQGEDLNVCNLVVANSDGDAVFDREFFLGRPDPVSTPANILYWNQEFRATLWGHLTLSNLSQLVEPIFTGFDRTTNPYDVPTNADVALETREQGGVVSYTHPASNALDLYDQAYAAKGSPVDVALGRIQALDVAGNTYPGSVQLWYHFLNCGFDVVASAGTDCFLNRVRSYPPGWARCYVHLPNGLNYADWVKGQVAGRSFITNGPAVFLEVEDRLPGGSIKIGKPGRLRVKAEALSHFAMEKVELVFNGEVIQQLPVEGDGQKAEFSGEIEIPHRGWLALRAEGPQDRLVFGRGMTAHTNVIRVEVGGKSWGSARSARYFLDWIDRLEADFDARNRVPSERRRDGVKAQLNAAREVYRKIAEAHSGK